MLFDYFDATGASPVDLAVHALDVISEDNEEILGLVDDYWRGEHRLPHAPAGMSRETRDLMEKSVQNWCRLPVSAITQTLAIEGFRQGGADKTQLLTDSPQWQMWQRSNLDMRADVVHESAATYGQMFVLSELRQDGKAYARLLSARHTTALYEDVLSDDNALFVLSVISYGGTDARGRAVPGLAYGWDRYQRYTLRLDMGSAPQIVKAEAHGGNGHNPVTRFTPGLDSEGRVQGEVAPIIEWQDTFNQMLFNLTSVQADSAFRTIFGTGIKREYMTDDSGQFVLDDSGQPVPVPIQVSPGNMLTATNADSKFGVLPGSDQNGYIASMEMLIKQFSALTQTPLNFLGMMVNVSAEALDAIEKTFRRKIARYQRSLGESWERVLRIGMILEGQTEVDTWEHGEVVWTDFDSYLLSAKADALAKIADSLDVPKRGLWPMIPGVSAGLLDEWHALADAADSATVGANMADWMTVLNPDDSGGNMTGDAGGMMLGGA